MDNTIYIIMIAVGVFIIGVSAFMAKKQSGIKDKIVPELEKYLKRKLGINIFIGVISIVAGIIQLLVDNKTINLIVAAIFAISILAAWIVDILLKKSK